MSFTGILTRILNFQTLDENTKNGSTIVPFRVWRGSHLNLIPQEHSASNKTSNKHDLVQILQTVRLRIKTSSGPSCSRCRQLARIVIQLHLPINFEGTFEGVQRGRKFARTNIGGVVEGAVQQSRIRMMAVRRD